MDDQLNLPIFTGEHLPPALRSIDEINDWIEENYLDFFDRESYEREKRKLSVNVRFTIEE
jgi:hypothetical protein